jgi:hypothetical protein
MKATLADAKADWNSGNPKCRDGASQRQPTEIVWRDRSSGRPALGDLRGGAQKFTARSARQASTRIPGGPRKRLVGAFAPLSRSTAGIWSMVSRMRDQHGSKQADATVIAN